MIQSNPDKAAREGRTDAVTQALRQIMRAVDLHSRLLASKYGLTAPQLTVIKELAQVERLSMGQLAAAVKLAQPTTGGIVDRLVKRGLVRRATCQEDRRRVLVELTEQGRATAQRSPAPLQESFRRQFEKLRDWEQTLILASLQRLVGMMAAGELDATPILTTGPMAASSEQMLSFLDPGPAGGSESNRSARAGDVRP
jgi:DNA-binding MarR family transcriptional regulator